MALLLLLLGGVITYLLTRPDQVFVPTVLDKNQAAAQAILEDAGLEVAVKEEVNPKPEGTVLEQFPLAGDEVDEGSTVTITVSLGPDTAVVPDVTEQRAAQARRTLEDAGFEVREDRRPSASVRAGLAVGTEPPAGRTLERGRTVTLVISSGARPVEVPSVIGLQQDLAESALRGEGLIPNFETRDSDEPEGQVIAQDPAAGSTVKRHTAVTVVVSTGAGSAIVPNVVGQSKDQARAGLRDAGLSVRIVKRTTSDQNEDDQVLEQSPTAGTRLRQGEFVTIFVGKFSEPPTTTTTTPAP
jgi:serine/threonine-protein kinase